MKVLGVWEKSFEGVSGGHEVRLMVFVSEVNIRTTPVNKTLSLHCYRKYKTGAALRSGGGTSAGGHGYSRAPSPPPPPPSTKRLRRNNPKYSRMTLPRPSVLPQTPKPLN